MLEELILKAWERAGKPPNNKFVHSIIYGDAPVVVTLAKEIKRLKEFEVAVKKRHNMEMGRLKYFLPTGSQ